MNPCKSLAVSVVNLKTNFCIFSSLHRNLLPYHPEGGYVGEYKYTSSFKVIWLGPPTLALARPLRQDQDRKGDIISRICTVYTVRRILSTKSTDLRMYT